MTKKKRNGQTESSTRLAPVSGSTAPIANWRECQQWIMDNSEVVNMVQRGEIGEALWKAWREAYARGAEDRQKLAR